MQQEYITTKTKLIVAFAVLAIFAGIAELGNFLRERDLRETASRNEARISVYRAKVATLDKIEENTGRSSSDYYGLIEDLSEALKNRKVTSAELDKLVAHPIYENNWLADYRTRVRLLEGKEKLNRLIKLANSDRKKSSLEIQLAQELGAEINGVNQEISDWMLSYYSPINVNRGDIARLIKRVKNPELPKVTIEGYWANFTAGG